MTSVLYRDFQIIYWPPPIPIRRWDWHFAHLEFCGDGDNRHGDAGSLEEAKHLIDEWWEEAEAAERERFDDDPTDDFHTDFDWIQP